MFRKAKDWFVEAVSNGGAVLAIVGVLLAGAVGEVAQPVDRIGGLINGAAHEPIANEPIDLNPTGWKCPDTTWAFDNGYDADVGTTFETCKKNKVIIRHFDRVAPGKLQDQAQDQGVYPFEDLDSVDAAIRIANSR